MAIDWAGLLERKYAIQEYEADVAKMNAEANAANADTNYFKANTERQGTENEYNIAQERYAPGGLEERLAKAQNATTLGSTSISSAGVQAYRAAEARKAAAEAAQIDLNTKLVMDEIGGQSRLPAPTPYALPPIAQPSTYDYTNTKPKRKSSMGIALPY